MHINCIVNFFNNKIKYATIFFIYILFSKKKLNILYFKINIQKSYLFLPLRSRKADIPLLETKYCTMRCDHVLCFFFFCLIAVLTSLF